MIRLGMHSCLWTDVWSEKAAELALPEAAKYGMKVVEIALLTPEKINVPHSVALLKQFGVEAPYWTSKGAQES